MIVSAICPTFNRPKFLRKAVELFNRQTMSAAKRELIIVDDSPNPPERFDSPNIKHIHLANRKLVIEKYNEAFGHVRGKLICTWDDDDWHGQTRLEDQARYMLDKSIDASGYAVGTMVVLPGPRFMVWKPETIARWARQTLRPVPFHDGSAMWRKYWLDCLPRSVFKGPQLSWYTKIIKESGTVETLPNIGQFTYVRHPRCGWSFDVNELCDPAPRPSTVTDEMMAFWQDDRVYGEAI